MAVKNNTISSELIIDGLDCQNEKALLDKKMGALSGIREFEVNIFAQQLRVCFDPAEIQLRDIIRSVGETGMKARVQRGRGKLKEVVLDCCSVELDQRGGLVDYERRRDADVTDCECD